MRNWHVPVIFNNGEFIFVNKPAGIAVQVHQRTRTATIANYLAKHAPDWIHAHRIDKGTSGITMIKRKDVRLPPWHANTRKTYLTVIPDPDWEEKLNLRPVAQVKDGEFCGMAEAETHFNVLQRKNGLAVVVCTLRDSGRYRQIRQHAAQLGTPLLGDWKIEDTMKLYKSGYTLPQAPQSPRKDAMLHAWRMDFRDASGVTHHVQAPIPKDFRELPGFDWDAINAGASRALDSWKIPFYADQL